MIIHHSANTCFSFFLFIVPSQVRLLRNDLRNLKTQVEDIGNRLPGVNLSLVNKVNNNSIRSTLNLLYEICFPSQTDLANEIWAVLNRHLGSVSQVGTIDFVV